MVSAIGNASRLRFGLSESGNETKAAVESNVTFDPWALSTLPHADIGCFDHSTSGRVHRGDKWVQDRYHAVRENLASAGSFISRTFGKVIGYLRKHHQEEFPATRFSTIG